jgi:hypothetical protein
MTCIHQTNASTIIAIRGEPLTTKTVEEAWGRGNAAAVLLMDNKGAFPHVAKGT